LEDQLTTKKTQSTIPPTITENDVKKTNAIFWLNLLLCLIGCAAYWYCWILLVPVSLLVSIYIARRIRHTKNINLAKTAVVFGVLTFIAALASWILLGVFISYFYRGGQALVFAITSPIVLSFAVIYAILSSISLFQIKTRYEEYLYNIRNETTSLLVEENRNLPVNEPTQPYVNTQIKNAPVTQTPPTFQQSPTTFQQHSPSFQHPPTIQQPPPTFQQPPSTFQQSPSAFQQPPSNLQQQPANFQQQPANFQQQDTY